MSGTLRVFGLDVSVRARDVTLGPAVVRTGVAVATGVVEIFPDSFTMHARIRSDEFIARAHRAAYTI